MDYASRILNSEQPASSGKDYAANLVSGGPDQNLVGAGDSIAQAKKSGISIDDLPIANKDAGVNDRSTAASWTLTKAASVDDPSTKLGIFARARFPKDPNAIHRYGLIDDQVVYLGDDDKLYRETPKGLLMGAKEFATGLAGKAAPIVGGAIGGSVAGGPATGLAGAAAGAFGGEGVRKILGGLVFDEPQNTGDVLKSMLAEGAWSGAGSLIGGGVVKYLNRNAARDLSRLDATATADIQAKARRNGIELNPAQATNLPSLKGKFEALARLPTSADIIDRGMQGQAQQANDATHRFLHSISPRQGLEEIGEDGVNAAGNVISMLVKDRADAASPLYQKAFASGAKLTPETSPVLKDLMQRPAMKAAMNKAVELAKNEGLDVTDPANSLLRAHFAKLALDDAIEKEAKYATGSTFQRGLIGIKEKLLNEMDAVSPDYKTARDTFAHFSPSVEAIRTGVVNRIANLPPEKVSDAARLLFQPGSSPNTVAKTRTLFGKAGMQEDYDALLKSYLQQSFEKAGREFKSGSGGPVGQAPSWRAAMVGDPSQASVLKAAMDGRQYAAFNELMDVFEAMGRVTGKGNSITMPMQEAATALRQQAGTSVAAKVDKVVRPWSLMQAWGTYSNEIRQGKHAERLAEIMTSVDGMKQLKELVRLPPASEKFLQKAGALFGITAGPMPSQDEQ